MVNKSSLLEKWSFPWPVMDVLIGGNSSIDLPSLNVQDKNEANQFILGYGYDPDNLADQKEIQSMFVEAVAFISKHLITSDDREAGVEIPKKIIECEDIRDLFIWASNISPRTGDLAKWSCAILRVMHTIAHIDGVTRHTHITDARDQIFSRFLTHIFRKEDGTLWLGDKSSNVQLERVEWKPQKERHSIILKLLHKRGNVAETIYDLLGIRIITTRWCDVIMAVKYLRQFHMITFANCIPSRSANSLVDTGKFRTQLDTIREMLMSKAIKASEFEALVSRLETELPHPVHSNPHSSSSYRSVQLTCRQLIRSPNPSLAWIEKLRSEADFRQLPQHSRRLCQQLINFVEGWHTVRESMETEAFFPFEVQIMDGKNYQQVVTGTASHDTYKRSQIKAARQRILGAILPKSEEEPS